MKLVKDTGQLQKKNRKISDATAEEAVRTIIQWIGENPDREGLKSTPKRVIKAYKEYFQGYEDEASHYLRKTFTEVEGYDDMVIEKNINIRVPTIPPIVDATRDTPSAIPGLPFLVNGYPSNDVTTDDGVPGALIVTAVIEPP